MATVAGGYKYAGNVSTGNSGSGSQNQTYTVPAGEFAILTLMASANNTNLNQLTIQRNGTSILIDVPGVPSVIISDFFLGAGESVNVAATPTSGNCTVWISGTLFKNP